MNHKYFVLVDDMLYAYNTDSVLRFDLKTNENSDKAVVFKLTKGQIGTVVYKKIDKNSI